MTRNSAPGFGGRRGGSPPPAAPLVGVRVATTRSASAEDRLGALLERAGARVLAWPTCAYPPPCDPAPLEAARARIDRFGWLVFTSARAVAAMGEGRSAPVPRVAAVGPATARAAVRAGWPVAVEGRGPGARGLAARVAETATLEGARVLFPAASGAASTVEEEFAALGARVARVEAYRTVATPPPVARVRADLVAGVDAVAFASPAAVEAVDGALSEAGEDAGAEDPARSLARALAGVRVVCIGPATAAAAERRGIAEVRVAPTATLEGIVDALAELFGRAGCGRPDAEAGRASRADGADLARRSGVRP